MWCRIIFCCQTTQQYMAFVVPLQKDARLFSDLMSLLTGQQCLLVPFKTLTNDFKNLMWLFILLCQCSRYGLVYVKAQKLLMEILQSLLQNINDSGSKLEMNPLVSNHTHVLMAHLSISAHSLIKGFAAPITPPHDILPILFMTDKICMASLSGKSKCR